MLHTGIIAGLHFGALALSAIAPELGEAAFTLALSASGLLTLALPGTRAALLDVLARFWPAALCYGALVAVVAAQAALPGSAFGARHPFAAASETFDLIALALGCLAVAGVATHHGRRAMETMLLTAALGLAALAAARAAQSDGAQALSLGAGQAGVVFALFAGLAAGCLHQELRSPQAAGARPRRPRAHRAMTPALALVGTLLGALLTSAAAAAGAAVLGAAVLAALLAARRRRRRGSVALLALAVTLAFGGGVALLAKIGQADAYARLEALTQSFQAGLAGAAGLGSGAPGGVIQTWPREAGWAGALLLGASIGLFVASLIQAKDRGRRPSRGAALAACGVVIVAIAGLGGSGPAASATLALLLGLAASYRDDLHPAIVRARGVPHALGSDGED